VAVGTYLFDDRWDISNALYGHDAIERGESTDGTIVTRRVRQPDGYFGVPPNWQNRHVSGVLLVNQLKPYSLLRAEASLWRHPNPLHALPEVTGFPCLTVALEGNRLAETPAPFTAASFFDLAEPWPPGQPFPRS